MKFYVLSRLAMDFQELPKNYAKDLLHKNQLHKDPLKQFLQWIESAKNMGIKELNAMALATSSKEGKPSCRMVLLKHVDAKGLVFFTNHESRKGKELEENPYASAVIFWPEAMQQICIEGEVAKILRENSETYFHSRHRESQIAAWASPQGKEISSKKKLEEMYQEMKNQHAGKEVPLPPFWGGYLLSPIRFEFWQGGRHRLHDRFQYKKENGLWNLSRLCP